MRIDTPPTLYTKQEAERVAEGLQSGELDGWSYKVAPRGRWAVVRVYDEVGVFVGEWAEG